MADDLAGQLEREGHGDAVALRELLPAVYADLKRIAHRQLLRGVGGPTLSTTVVVHEAWARIADAAPCSRAHFVSLCARVMRQVIVDHVRTRMALKRGGGIDADLLADDEGDAVPQATSLLFLAEALEALERSDPRLVRMIEQHGLLGLDADELARLHGLSPRSVQRELKRARAWLATLLDA